jgi:hypothetical protein
MPLAVVVTAAALAAAAPAVPAKVAVPPIIVDLMTAPGVSAPAVSIAINEVEALFRSAGVRFIWRRGDHLPRALRVVIASEPGPALAARAGATPLGWLLFENEVPIREIHVSYANAERLMETSREIVGLISQKTIAERDLYLGRALGRALAHELGHYLLATKAHTPKGLLKGARTAQEFFAVDRSPFAMNAVERGRIVARVREEFDVA